MTDTISSFLCRQYTKIMNIYMSTIDISKFVDLNITEMKTVNSNILYIGILLEFILTELWLYYQEIICIVSI